jgi:predicted RNase H-like HicB family nuclease
MHIITVNLWLTAIGMLVATIGMMAIARQASYPSWGRESVRKTRRNLMQHRVTMVYWKGERFWLGKLLEHPHIMTQGETLEELEDNLKDAYREMVLEDVPADYEMKEIAL